MSSQESESEAARVAGANEFAASKHPGMVGVEILSCTKEEVTGHFVVTEPVVAGTGYLWAPVVITLADWLCSVGIGEHIDFDRAGFTTVELKTNFLGTAREGERVFGRARPVHVGRTTHVWDVEVINQASEKTIALFRCTQMILYRS
jgi:1,4-dihydroxy-2-naphthoyl-CoA hydrolase